MKVRSSTCCAALWGAARAAQPGAVAPVAAPMRDLVWGQLNFLHTTDTHGWLGGHLLEPQYSADWGDYVSFAEHMRKQADEDGVDLLLIDTGDRVEGNGIYDASKPKGLFTYDIFREQNVDIVCTGNHELYLADTADRERQFTVPNYKDNYLASNLDYIDPKTKERIPMSKRYKKFKTKKLGIEVGSFGFLFNFEGNANNTIVQPVQETIKEAWFQMAIREKPDLFIVIGHVGLRMPEFRAIFTAIRQQNWYTPIAFFGGHAHVRDAVSFDKNAFAMASGRYFETIGWMSIDGLKPKKTEVSAEASVSFSRRYIDNNLYGLYYHTGLNQTTFPTNRGKMVSSMITRARGALNLDYKYGCAPRDLWMSRAEYPSNGSIYTWLETEVLPDIVTRKDRRDVPRLAILNTGGIRFDIFKGPFTRDSTYIVSPFISGFSYIPDIPYATAKKVLQLLNSGKQILEAAGLSPQVMSIPEMAYVDRLATPPPDTAFKMKTAPQSEQRPLGGGGLDEPALISGYTTRDDVGSDGDDTVHSAVKFYSVPNCVQAEIEFPEEGEPDKVDLVFIDFIQPWIIVALKFGGGDYSESDVQVYNEGTFTYQMAEWIKANWKGDC